MLYYDLKFRDKQVLPESCVQVPAFGLGGWYILKIQVLAFKISLRN